MGEPDWDELENWARAGGRLVLVDWSGSAGGQWLMLPGASTVPPARRSASAEREHRRARSAKKRRKRN